MVSLKIIYLQLFILTMSILRRVHYFFLQMKNYALILFVNIPRLGSFWINLLVLSNQMRNFEPGIDIGRI